MKKVLMLIVVAMVATMTYAQDEKPQVNGSFDAEWVDCYPWEKGAKVKDARGTQPVGWCMANVNGMGGLGATVVGAQGDDANGNEKGHSVTLTNTPNPFSASQIVPGYMSIGTTWATAKATITGSVSAADGGSFGGMEFTARPKSLKLKYKRAHNVEDKTKYTNVTERASVVAYLWKGTWTQAGVPSNTAMGNPTKVTMTDRSNNILDKPCLQGGAISKTEDAELIAVIEYYIEGDAAEWTEVEIPFEYKSEATPEKINIILAANDLFADRSGIGSGNQLCVDDVELVYADAPEVLKGDADNNGVVEMNDAKVTVDKFLGKDVEINEEAADMNEDKVITVSDANAIINTVVK